MRWLLHTRRVPVQRRPAVQPLGAAVEPACAGVGNADVPCWLCRDCASALCKHEPSMPKCALANDFWLGRERPEFRELSDATKWLLSLGRPCWKKVCLGRRSSSANELQCGSTGNVIFVAQPTAGVPQLQLPPDDSFLNESITVAFTGSQGSMNTAKWARVPKQQYLACAIVRKKVNPAFAEVQIDEAALTNAFPEGAPATAVQACAVHLVGVDDIEGHVAGPAHDPTVCARSNDLHQDVECTDVESEGEDTMDACIDESTIAVDQTNDHCVARMFDVCAQQIKLIEKEARRVLSSESRAKIEDADGVLQPVADVGGRRVLQQMFSDLRGTCQALGNEDARMSLEAAASGPAHQRPVVMSALKIPTGKPLNMFDPITWTVSFVEFMYGDGTPNLQRLRPLLLHEWAAAILEREELEYSIPSDTQLFQARSPSRFVTPEIIACIGDTQRRMETLMGTKAALSRAGFAHDITLIQRATPEDYLAACRAVGDSSRPADALAHQGVGQEVKAALRTLLLSTASVPGTEGYRVRLRHWGGAMNLLFGVSKLFVTTNFADARSPLVLLLDEGPPGTKRSRHFHLSNNDVDMPSLQEMHVRIAANPRAQAKFFLLMTELFYRHVLGLDQMSWGAKKLGCPARQHREDFYATSLQPSIVGFATAALAPGEAQARGFEHSHGLVHCVEGLSIQLLLRLINGDDEAIENNVRRWREQCLAAASSVVYDSATETAAQCGIRVDPEPMSVMQQKQSRMDGGAETDGSLRQHVEVWPEISEGHIARESREAAASNREVLPSFKTPLVGCQRAALPPYRLKGFFGEIHGSSGCSLPVCSESNGEVTGWLNDAEVLVDQNYLDRDAEQFAQRFCEDNRELQALNHNHTCKTTCWKYLKNHEKIEDKNKASGSVPTCRFGFFHVVQIGAAAGKPARTVRRRGKALVPEPYIVETDELKEAGRIRVKRSHPFRSTTSDVAQVCARCNVDVQWIERCPTMCTYSSSEIDNARMNWTYGLGMSKKASQTMQAVLCCFTLAFRAAHDCGYYITKYAAKTLQTLEPMMRKLAEGIQNLKEEEDKSLRQLDSGDPLVASNDPREQSKLTAKQRARKMCLRLAFSINRSVWLSCTEISVIILTRGAALHTHADVPLFFRKIVFMATQAKRLKNGVSTDVHDVDSRECTTGSVATSGVQASFVDVGEDEDGFVDRKEQDTRVEMRLDSVNLADMYAHRGHELAHIGFYFYVMYFEIKARRVYDDPWDFEFDPHFSLFQTHVQNLRKEVKVPRICGFQCPTLASDQETNCMFKSLCFAPVSCEGPGKCQHVTRFNSILMPTVHRTDDAGVHRFDAFWKPYIVRNNMLARTVDARQAAAVRLFSIHDCVEFRSWVNQEHSDPAELAQCSLVHRCLKDNHIPIRCRIRIIGFICATHLRDASCLGRDGCRAMGPGFHDEQPTLEEFHAHLVRRVAANVDLASEARCRPKGVTKQRTAIENDASDDDSGASQGPNISLEAIGLEHEVGFEDMYDDDQESICSARYPIGDPNLAIQLVCRVAEVRGAKGLRTLVSMV